MLNPQTLNLYAYVNNNPLRLIDPTGHEAKDSRNDVSTAGKPSNSAIRRAEWEAQAYRDAMEIIEELVNDHIMSADMLDQGKEGEVGLQSSKADASGDSTNIYLKT